MAGKTRETAVGVAVLVALGAGMVAVGVLSLDAGVGTRVYQDDYGQQSMPVLLLIPAGVAFLALALIIPLAELRRSPAHRAAVQEEQAADRAGLRWARARFDPAATVVEFNDAVGRRDVDGLARLMTDDHVLVDTTGAVIRGKPQCLETWRGFFAAFPDYRNVFESVEARGNVVTIAGHAECSDPILRGAATWTAVVQDDRVAEWRVHHRR